MPLPPAVALRLSTRIRTVSPQWFRRSVLPAYGGTWTAAHAAMAADVLESRRLDELAAEITRRGIERPVNLHLEHPWSPRFTVGDGMHRAIAAMHLGLPIPVARNYEHPDLHPATDVYRISAAGVDAESLSTAVLSLTSFRSPAGAWIQTDSAFGSGPDSIEVFLPHQPDYRTSIADQLAQRLGSTGIAANVEFVRNEVN